MKMISVRQHTKEKFSATDVAVGAMVKPANDHILQVMNRKALPAARTVSLANKDIDDSLVVVFSRGPSIELWATVWLEDVIEDVIPELSVLTTKGVVGGPASRPERDDVLWLVDEVASNHDNDLVWHG